MWETLTSNCDQQQITKKTQIKDQTQKLKIGQIKKNSFAKLQNWKCVNSKTQIVTKPKLWENSKTQIVTKPQNSNCDKTQIVTKRKITSNKQHKIQILTTQFLTKL